MIDSKVGGIGIQQLDVSSCQRLYTLEKSIDSFRSFGRKLTHHVENDKKIDIIKSSHSELI